MVHVTEVDSNSEWRLRMELRSNFNIREVVYGRIFSNSNMSGN